MPITTRTVYRKFLKDFVTSNHTEPKPRQANPKDAAPDVLQQEDKLAASATLTPSQPNPKNAAP